MKKVGKLLSLGYSVPSKHKKCVAHCVGFLGHKRKRAFCMKTIVTC